jgi:hypothetical protein
MDATPSQPRRFVNKNKTKPNITYIYTVRVYISIHTNSLELVWRRAILQMVFLLFSHLPLLSYIWCPCFISCYDRPWPTLTTPQFRVCGNGKIRVKSTRERRSSWIYTQYHQIGKQRKNKYNSISEPRHWELSRGFLGMFDLINIERTRDSSIVGGYNNIAQEKRRVLCARISQLSFFLFLTINPQQHRSIRRSRMIVRISISCLKMKNIYGDCNGVINIRVHAVLLKLISAWKRNFLK